MDEVYSIINESAVLCSCYVAEFVTNKLTLVLEKGDLMQFYVNLKYSLTDNEKISNFLFLYNINIFEP